MRSERPGRRSLRRRPMSAPLAGVRVIELAGTGPGPFCAMMLADRGAEVIRIDRLGARGPAADTDRDFPNRSHKSLAVDLKSEEGVALVQRLCERADAVLEGCRPGVMERLGDNPRLVYGRMAGWGQTGPYAPTAGDDINYISLSGALHAGRARQRPTPPMNLISDFGGRRGDARLWRSRGDRQRARHRPRPDRGPRHDRGQRAGDASRRGTRPPQRRAARLRRGGPCSPRPPPATSRAQPPDPTPSQRRWRARPCSRTSAPARPRSPGCRPERSWRDTPFSKFQGDASWPIVKFSWRGSA